MRAAVCVLLLASCGRLGFDPSDVATDNGNDDSITGDGNLQSPDGEVSQVDLLAWFRFEPGANFLRDEITGMFATCANCPTEVAGPVGGAARFDGTACLQFADRPALQTNVLTIEAFFRPNNFGEGVLLARPANGDVAETNNWLIGERGPDAVAYTFYGTGGLVSGVTPSIDIGSWSHVAIAHNSSDNNAYLDGAPVGQNFSDAGTMVFSNDDLRIGCDLDNGNLVNFLDGDLDEIKIYGRFLTPAEVAIDANS